MQSRKSIYNKKSPVKKFLSRIFSYSKLFVSVNDKETFDKKIFKEIYTPDIFL